MAKRRPREQSLFDNVDAADPSGGGTTDGVSLHEAAQSRYLNYALSVITSRALPDVRDGLKPVQRRILYTMWQQNLTADAKHRKCAKVVGDVMGSYHPHGAAVLAALPGRGRLGQFRIARWRRRCRDAVYGMPSRPHQRRPARRDRADHGSLPPELRRHEDRTGCPSRTASEPAGERHDRDCRRDGDERPAAQSD